MFSIKFNSGIPIYRQVVDQVVRQIDRGQLDLGERLPSVRQLAGDLGVNPMTVSRAYSMLNPMAWLNENAVWAWWSSKKLKNLATI